MIVSLEKLARNMNDLEIITKKSRSEGAKRMWKRRKALMTTSMHGNNQSTNTSFKPWVYHAEWLALMGTLIYLFACAHGETVHINERLDSHIEAINRRVDDSNNQLNKRCDELHKEFYDLLKEMRAERGE